MKHIIIAVVAISVNVIIMYILGNKIVGLRLRSLMMCGLCALLLSLVLPPVVVNVTSLAGKIGFYALFAIILAGLVVYYDDMKERRSAVRSSKAMEIGTSVLPELEVFRKSELEDKVTKVGIDTMLVDSVTENMESPMPYNSPCGQVIEAEPLPTFETSESQLYSELLLEPIIAYRAYGKSSISESPAANVDTIILSEVIDDKLAESSIHEEDSMLISNPEVKLQKNTNVMEIRENQTEFGPTSDSLDDLLECAFSYKERGEDSDALDTFKCALNLYRDKEIAPLLVIEIAKLLKNEGAYDEAITLLIENRNLPGLHENHGLDQDFIHTIAYLRIIKNTLTENNLSYIPISKIPEDIVRKIVDEFHKWRNFI